MKQAARQFLTLSPAARAGLTPTPGRLVLGCVLAGVFVVATQWLTPESDLVALQRVGHNLPVIALVAGLGSLALFLSGSTLDAIAVAIFVCFLNGLSVAGGDPVAALGANADLLVPSALTFVVVCGLLNDGASRDAEDGPSSSAPARKTARSTLTGSASPALTWSPRS